MLRNMIVATQFLTRVSLSHRPVEAHELAPAVAYFPLVGAMVGAVVSGLVAAATPFVGMDIAIVAGLIFGALLTGALHEDGLADTCDGLGGGSTRAHALEIMRDSRIGSYGAVALVLLYAARFATFRTLGVAQLLLAFPVASTLARASSVVLMAWLPNARTEGVAEDVARSLGRSTTAIGIVTPLLLTALMCGTAAPLLVAAAAVATVTAALYLRKRLGGITGDCLGAVNVVAEAATLMAAVAWTRAHGTLEVLQWP